MVNKLRAYRIAFRGLGLGTHLFEYVLDDAFFDNFESTKGTQGQVRAEVELVKRSLLMEVKVSIRGKVKGICDRCLGELEVAVAGEMKLYVKQSGREEGNEDDFIVLSPEDDFLDMGAYLYETYMLNRPMRVVHDEGECDESMRQVLEEYVRTEDCRPADPRWDGLKKLIH